jgi:hypothetical protein
MDAVEWGYYGVKKISKKNPSAILFNVSETDLPEKKSRPADTHNISSVFPLEPGDKA